MLIVIVLKNNTHKVCLIFLTRLVPIATQESQAKSESSKEDAGTAEEAEVEEEAEGDSQPSAWFYEGHNGWWQYDERTSAELESHRDAGDASCELLIAGYVYHIDLGLMVQFRRDEPARRRRIKRDRAEAPKKGIAGLRLPRTTPRHRQPYPALAAQDDNDDGASGGAGAAPDDSVAQLGQALARDLMLSGEEQEEDEQHSRGNAVKN